MYAFDAGPHTYTIDGRAVPSVTGILSDLGISDFAELEAREPLMMERARNFGSAVHRLCELHEKKVLDMGTVDPELVPYLDGWTSFLETLKPEPEFCELKVFSRKYRYAGTLDRTYIVDGKRWLVDIKTGCETPAWQLQLAGYDHALAEMMGLRADVRASVILRPYKWSLVRYSGAQDQSLFLSAVSVYHYKHSGEVCRG